MVLKVLSHPRQLNHHLDARRLQYPPRPNTTQLQNLRRMHRPRRQNHLPPRPHRRHHPSTPRPPRRRRHPRHAHRPPPLHHHPRHLGPRHHHIIRPHPRLPIDMPRPRITPDYLDRIHKRRKPIHPRLPGPAILGKHHPLHPPPRLHQHPRHRKLITRPPNHHLPLPAPPLRIELDPDLPRNVRRRRHKPHRPPEIRQQPLPRPSPGSGKQPPPPLIILPRPPDRHHGIDRRAPAHHLADLHRRRAVP